jgi:exosortase D (VPLPA-CTERM-specific)
MGVALGSLALAFLPGLERLMETWNTVEEYSFGWFIAPLVVFLVWQQSDVLRARNLVGRWGGLLLVALAVILCVAGRLSLVRLLLQYGFVIGVWGVVVCAIGWSGFRAIGLPLAMLVLMIPLPHFILNDVSEQLQLISSQLGVSIIRMCDIPVFLEGNIIDLGAMKLQVVDACSGLRYLFPLMALGLIAVYFYRAALWKRVLIVVSTVPLTILINSARIGLIGITVEYWGRSMAEGLLHDFEGWFMFMVCMLLLVAEMAILARIGSPHGSLRKTFAVDLPQRRAPNSNVAPLRAPRPLQFAAAASFALALIALAVPMRNEVLPERESFTSFPLQLPGGWIGRASQLDAATLATLQLDDYLLVDYANASGPPVNFYVAYYASQDGAEKASHSPRTCIPAGGWTISDAREITVPLAGQRALTVNRAVIERNGQRQLAYYWFKQGDRNIANDWLIKWYIVTDSVRRGRTDGALIRLVAPIPANASVDSVDARLADFARTTEPLVARYVPD